MGKLSDLLPMPAWLPSDQDVFSQEEFCPEKPRPAKARPVPTSPVGDAQLEEFLLKNFQLQKSQRKGNRGKQSARRYRLQSCDYPEERQLAWHMKDAHYRAIKVPGMWQSPSLEEVRGHALTHTHTHTPENYRCRICGVVFRDRTTAIYHAEEEHTRQPEVQVIKVPARATGPPVRDRVTTSSR